MKKRHKSKSNEYSILSIELLPSKANIFCLLGGKNVKPNDHNTK